MSEPKANVLPDWDRVLTAAAHLQELLPAAVLVGGSAAAIHAQHRVSVDADHVLTDLRERFDEILVQLEEVAGWKTARICRPVQILGSLDGIETGIRQLIRTEPLETQQVTIGERLITIPTEGEMLRIKAVLILKRNATRDYLDFVAMQDRLQEAGTLDALRTFDQFYPQPNGQSAVQQLLVQLANPLPYDLEQTRLDEYKALAPKWTDWQVVAEACARCSTLLFTGLGRSRRR